MRLFTGGLIVVAATLAFSWTFGHVSFGPSATDMLVRVAALFGIYGDEKTEDFYMVSTMLLSLVLAIGIVSVAMRWLAARSDRRGLPRE